MEIVEVDPADDAQYAAWYAVYAEADRADRGPDADTWSPGESRAELLQESAVTRRRALAGVVRGEVVVSAWIALPLKDNRHRAAIGLHVAPAARRRGLGTRMLAHLETRARRHGRTVVDAETRWPYAGGPTGRGAAGVEFGRRHGYELALADVRRRLDLPVDDGLLERLAREASAHHRGYRLRSWTGAVPDELVAEWAALDAALDTEAPTGGRDLEVHRAEVATVRETEELVARQGRTSFHTVAIDPAGTLAGYTHVVVSGDDGGAYQWGTLVRAGDRGHRLGVALKVANLRLLQRERPDVGRLTTYNAEANAAMVAVNDALGYVPIERLGELQKRLGP